MDLFGKDLLYLTCLIFIMIHAKTKTLMSPFYGTACFSFAKLKQVHTRDKQTKTRC